MCSSGCRPVHVHLWLQVPVHVHLWLQVPVYVHLWLQVPVHVHLWLQVPVHVHLWLQVPVHVLLWLRVPVYVHLWLQVLVAPLAAGAGACVAGVPQCTLYRKVEHTRQPAYHPQYLSAHGSALLALHCVITTVYTRFMQGVINTTVVR